MVRRTTHIHSASLAIAGIGALCVLAAPAAGATTPPERRPVLDIAHTLATIEEPIVGAPVVAPIVGDVVAQAGATVDQVGDDAIAIVEPLPLVGVPAAAIVDETLDETLGVAQAIDPILASNPSRGPAIAPTRPEPPTSAEPTAPMDVWTADRPAPLTDVHRAGSSASSAPLQPRDDQPIATTAASNRTPGALPTAREPRATPRAAALASDAPRRATARDEAPPASTGRDRAGGAAAGPATAATPMLPISPLADRDRVTIAPRDDHVRGPPDVDIPTQPD